MGELMNLIQLLDIAKERNSFRSDVKLAEALDMKSANITRFRKRQQFPSGTTCIKLAQLSGVSDSIVLAVVQMEKADTPAESNAWKTIAQIATTMSVVFVLSLASMGAASSNVYASEDITSNIENETYYPLCDVVILAVILSFFAAVASNLALA
ncbi:MAG: hypothetical protein R8K20_02055, partial [Gallionellaceae bacterium]